MREQPGEDTKERLRKALQHFKILPQTSDRQQMTEEERYIDYGFEHRVTAVKGIYNNGLLLWDCADKCHYWETKEINSYDIAILFRGARVFFFIVLF